MLVALKYHHLVVAPKYHHLLVASKYHHLLVASKYHHLLEALKCHHLLVAPKYHHLLNHTRSRWGQIMHQYWLEPLIQIRDSSFLHSQAKSKFFQAGKNFYFTISIITIIMNNTKIRDLFKVKREREIESERERERGRVWER